MMNLRLVKPAVLIDINRVPGLADIRVDGGELVIGALARHAALLASEVVGMHCPLMVEAYACVAHGPIRNRGTLGGNISHADPASEMPAVLAACDARIGVRSAKGARQIPATEFFTGALTTALAEGEMVTEIRIPIAKAGQGAAWQEVANRKGDFAMAGVAALVTVAGGKCASASLAVAGMEQPGVRLPAAEKLLVGTARRRRRDHGRRPHGGRSGATERLLSRRPPVQARAGRSADRPRPDCSARARTLRRPPWP